MCVCVHACARACVCVCACVKLCPCTAGGAGLPSELRPTKTPDCRCENVPVENKSRIVPEKLECEVDALPDCRLDFVRVIADLTYASDSRPGDALCQVCVCVSNSVPKSLTV